MDRKNTLCVLSMLLVSVLCSPACRADMLTTMFNANNGQSGNMFDINVLEPAGINISAFDLNLDPGNWNINVYTFDGTHVGNESNSAAWTLHDSINGLASNGFNNPTNWDITDLALTSGLQALYVEVTNGTGLNYTNGTGVGNLVAADSRLQIFEGTGNVVNFGTQFRPRVWNGTIHYAIPEPPMASLAGIVASGLMLRRKRRI